MITDRFVAAAGTPSVALNDRDFIPQIGFGVWQIANDEVGDAIATALDAGYRMIDTAQGYDNEAGVGLALRNAELPRSELFVTSKLRTRAMGREGALAGVRASLETLGLDYLDLMLIHWPTLDPERYVGAWQGLVEAREEGLVRNIGVSNCLPHHIERMIDETGVVPVVDQIETHPYFQQPEMVEYLRNRGIRHEAYSPLGSGTVLGDEVIASIAGARERSPAQIILRWHLQRGSIVIPKSVTPDRIRENFEVFNFTLSEAEMARIAGLDDPEHGRTGSDPDRFNDLY
ncbi:aldo/keto reductase [Devosia sp. CN2-171]|uniref:aldo/keto reductase n=1 Tax=Devosia sp. CN2-171 TaxID=3400909 RepID=UPI003BF7C2FC